MTVCYHNWTYIAKLIAMRTYQNKYLKLDYTQKQKNPKLINTAARIKQLCMQIIYTANNCCIDRTEHNRTEQLQYLLEFFISACHFLTSLISSISYPSTTSNLINWTLYNRRKVILLITKFPQIPNRYLYSICSNTYQNLKTTRITGT